MMNMTSISAKFMEEKLTEGWSTKDFCDKLELSEEEFDSLMEKAFAQRAKAAYCRRLSKNDKLRKKHIKNSANRSPVVVENNTVLSSPENAEVTSNEMPDTLEGMIELSNKLLSEIAEKEKLRKSLYEGCTVGKNKLLAYKADLEVMQRKVQELIALTIQTKESIVEIKDEVSKINSSIRDLKKHKSQIDGKIKELQTISILLYEDGNIGVVTGKFDPNTDIPENWMEYFQKLFDGEFGCDEILDSLTRAQIKQVSKIKALLDEKKNDIPYQFIAENENVQAVIDELLK